MEEPKVYASRICMDHKDEIKYQQLLYDTFNFEIYFYIHQMVNDLVKNAKKLHSIDNDEEFEMREYVILSYFDYDECYERYLKIWLKPEDKVPYIGIIEISHADISLLKRVIKVAEECRSLLCRMTDMAYKPIELEYFGWEWDDGTHYDYLIKTERRENKVYTYNPNPFRLYGKTDEII